MSRMTALIIAAALAVFVIDPLSMASAAVASQRCLRIAVLNIEPHGQTIEDGQSIIGGWFPLVCRHGAKFAETGQPTDIDINGKSLASKGDFTEICGRGTELGGKVSRWISNGVRLTGDAPTHDEDRICLALHPVGIFCGARAKMADVMSFRVAKGEIPIAVNEGFCPDR